MRNRVRFIAEHLKRSLRGHMAGLVEHATLDLRVMSSIPMLGLEPTLKKMKKEKGDYKHSLL